MSVGQRVAGDTTYRWQMDSNGLMAWGPGGSTAVDTNLYRSGVNQLKTDDSFAVGGALTPAVATLTFGVSIPLDASRGNAFVLTLTASTGTLANPTNPVDGQTIRVRVIQGGAGSFTLAFGTAYDFGSAGQPALSTAVSAVDILGFEYVASLSKWCFLGAGLGF
jgi:hypothetical protein